MIQTSMWFVMQMNGGTAYMRVCGGQWAGFYSLDGKIITPTTEQLTIENDVTAPAWWVEPPEEA